MRLDVVKIAGEKDTYRVRIGKFRALSRHPFRTDLGICGTSLVCLVRYFGLR